MHESTTRPYLWLFAILAVVGFAADQTSKYVIFAKLYPAADDPARFDVTRTSVDVIPGAFALTTFYTSARDSGDGALSFLRTISGARLPNVNRGALFGLGNDGEGMNSFFAAFSVLAVGFIVYWAARPAVASDRWLCIAFGSILGGTLGNLYDRIVFGGVRDFLDWYAWYKWADFNIADCCLVCGAGLLLAHSFLVKETTAEPAKPDTAIAEAPVPMETTSTPGA